MKEVINPKLLATIDILTAERDSLLERNRVLRDALSNFPTGHDHWDYERTHGQNCALCIRQREHKQEALAREAEMGKELK
jgi:hypothetical protein